MAAPEGRAKLTLSRTRSRRDRFAPQDRGDWPPQESESAQLWPNRHVAARREPRPPGETHHQAPERLSEASIISRSASQPCRRQPQNNENANAGQSSNQPQHGRRQRREDDRGSHAEHDHSHRLSFRTASDSALLFPVLKNLSDEPTAVQPLVELGRRPGQKETGQQKERRRRQSRKHGSGNAQRHEHRRQHAVECAPPPRSERRRRTRRSDAACGTAAVSRSAISIRCPLSRVNRRVFRSRDIVAAGRGIDSVPPE